MKILASNSLLFTVALGVCLGQGRAIAGEDVQGLPVYPAATSSPFQGDLSANDTPMNATVLNTKDNIETVLAFYGKAIRDRGLKPVQHAFSASVAYVGYYDDKANTMRMATVVADPSGGSMIVLSSMNPLPALLPVTVPEDLPFLPGATNVVKTGGQEASAKQRTITYRLPGATPDKARPALVKAAVKQGWKVDPDDNSYGVQSIVMKRGSEICVVQVQPSDNPEEEEVSTFVSMVVFETK
jgi:hypothetical protein